MSTPIDTLSNRDARRLWLASTGLADTPTAKAQVLPIIKALGYVQLDSIQNVTRAHHHILWSRHQQYREPMLDRLLGEERAVFEHFCHDACVLPMGSWPWWQRQYQRLSARYHGPGDYHRPPPAAQIEAVRQRIAVEGPLCSRDFQSDDHVRAIWARPAHKRALDYLWMTGVLVTAERRRFTKVYDLAERVIPAQVRAQIPSDEEQIDWLCQGALQRLVFASAGDLQRFWNAVSLDEARHWLARQPCSVCRPVSVQTAKGDARTLIAPADLHGRLETAPTPTSRLRIINPFDPAVRDRQRLRWLFGVDYTNEIFVPSDKRRWGYYVYLLLEGARFVGRLEARAQRRDDHLDVLRLWHEPGVRWGEARLSRLNAELARLARMIGVSEVRWRCRRLAEAPPD